MCHTLHETLLFPRSLQLLCVLTVAAVHRQYLHVLDAGGYKAYKITASALTSLPGDEDGFI